MNGQNAERSGSFQEQGLAGQFAGATDSAAALTYQGLRVSMLSAFKMEFYGRSINMIRGNSSKLIQLFAMLLLGGSKGVTKRELIDNIYGSGQEWRSDTNKSINNLLWRLRKQWDAWGMNGATIIFDGGSCRFEADFPVWVDAIAFQQKAQEALAYRGDDAAVRIALLEEAVGMYSGSFLNEFCTELWVIYRERELKQFYTRMVRMLGAEYERIGDLPKACGLYRAAAVLFPFDSWQLAEIDCLLAMSDYNGAYELYQNTERLYDEEMGIRPGQEYVKRLEVIEEHMHRDVRRLSDIAASLRGGAPEGAFYCSYSVFFNFCQILARLAERSGQSMFLLLCTWNGGTRGGRTAMEENALEEEQMAILKDVVGRVFRRGDIYTKYSRCQYLIILTGTGRENGAKAFERLYDAWKSQEGTMGTLSYSMESLVGFQSTDE